MVASATTSLGHYRHVYIARSGNFHVTKIYAKIFVVKFSQFGLSRDFF